MFTNGTSSQTRVCCLAWGRGCPGEDQAKLWKKRVITKLSESHNGRWVGSAGGHRHVQAEVKSLVMTEKSKNVARDERLTEN